MLSICVGCGRRTPNHVRVDGRIVHACTVACFSAACRADADAGLVHVITPAELRTAQPLPPAQLTALAIEPSTVRVMAYVPERPRSSLIATGAGEPAIYLRARRTPDGALVVDRFDNYTTPGHTWRAALVRAVPVCTAPAALHATPPAPAPAPSAPPTPALPMSAPIGAPLDASRSFPLYRARVRTAGACGHAANLEWAGTATHGPASFCSEKCATRLLGQPVRIVSNIGAALLAGAAADAHGWLRVPADSPLLRAHVHHPHTRPSGGGPGLISAELAQAAAACFAARAAPLPVQPIAARAKTTLRDPQLAQAEKDVDDANAVLEAAVTRAASADAVYRTALDAHNVIVERLKEATVTARELRKAVKPGDFDAIDNAQRAERALEVVRDQFRDSSLAQNSAYTIKEAAVSVMIQARIALEAAAEARDRQRLISAKMPRPGAGYESDSSGSDSDGSGSDSDDYNPSPMSPSPASSASSSPAAAAADFGIPPPMSPASDMFDDDGFIDTSFLAPGLPPTPPAPVFSFEDLLEFQPLTPADARPAKRALEDAPMPALKASFADPLRDLPPKVLITAARQTNAVLAHVVDELYMAADMQVAAYVREWAEEASDVELAEFTLQLVRGMNDAEAIAVLRERRALWTTVLPSDVAFVTELYAATSGGGNAVHAVRLRPFVEVMPAELRPVLLELATAQKNTNAVAVVRPFLEAPKPADKPRARRAPAKRAQLSIADTEALISAIEHEDEAGVAAIVATMPDINAPIQPNRTVLQLATQVGAVGIVKMLLAQPGINVAQESTSTGGKPRLTALTLTFSELTARTSQINERHNRIFAELIKHGARLSAFDIEEAVLSGRWPMVLSLMRDIDNLPPELPRAEATAVFGPGERRFLLLNGMLSDKQPITPELADIKKAFKCGKKLIGGKGGGKKVLYATDMLKRTPLYVAATRDKLFQALPAIVKFLAKKNKKAVNLRNAANGETPLFAHLHRVSTNGDMSIAEALLAAGADLRIPDAQDRYIEHMLWINDQEPVYMRVRSKNDPVKRTIVADFTRKTKLVEAYLRKKQLPLLPRPPQIVYGAPENQDI